MSEFTWPARVYWEDTDGGGIVYYANYLRFLERARTEWLRSLGHSQQELAHTVGMLFAVAGLTIEYRRPARLDDELTITCEPGLERATVLRFAQRIFRAPSEPQREGARGAHATAGRSADTNLLVEAQVRVVCVDARTLKPKKLPDFILTGLSLERT